MLKEIILHGEQRRILHLPPRNPIQIKGVAGSGKTTIALHRAKHLLETHSSLFEGTNIIIFTYNKTLAAYLEIGKKYINGGYNKDSEVRNTNVKPGLPVNVDNFHSWAYHFIDQNGRGHLLYDRSSGWQSKIISNSEKKSFINKCKSQNQNLRIASKYTEFFSEEFSWIKGQLINTLTEYQETKRTGRGTADRVTEADKEQIWQLFECYRSNLKKVGKIDFDDFAPIALEIIRGNDSFKPPFSHIIIDEAQDLSLAQLLVIKELVYKETNSLSIIADAAQRIVKSGFSWIKVGIEVRGRTFELRKNYRNTVEIASLAMSLLSHESDQSEFTEIENPIRSGELPKLIKCESMEVQNKVISSEIFKIRKKDPDGSIVVLYRSPKRVQGQLIRFLNSEGYKTEVINKKNEEIDFESGAIKLCTMSSIKGLEFDYVLIMDLTDDILPFPDGFVDENDENHISTERRLLYTCITRAREGLCLTYHGKPSRFLDELDSSLLQSQHIIEVL